MKIQYCCVLCTCPDILVAQGLSQILTEQNLAACVNLLPGVTSFFMWEAKLNVESEILMVIKTKKDKLEAIEELILTHHPYDTPELVALPIIWGSSDYLDFIDKTTGESIE